MANVSVGQEVPGFKLPDEEGKQFELPEKLSQGPVMLVFYRGDW